MPMTPLFFEASGRKLFGLLHAPDSPRPPAAAVVFCNPFGQEAIRSHRMFRVLADRVSRAGIAALRFDYSCTGDSEGDCTLGRVSAWIEDVRAADREVRRRSGATHVTWVGLRLGASLALLAADRDASAPRHLVLWDPVTSGAAYLEEMARAHVGFLAHVFRLKPARVVRARGIQALNQMPELVGFELTPELRAEIESIDLAQPRKVSATRVTILGDQSPEVYAPLRAMLAGAGITPDYTPVEADAPWDSEEALNSSTIPARTLDALFSAVEQRP